MNTKKIVTLGMLLALSLILTLVTIPYPPVPFLKFDLSDLILLIAVIIIGPSYAIIISIIKNFAFYFLGTESIIGPIAAMISSITMILAFYYAYDVLKLSKIKSLIITTLIVSLVMTVMNYLLITPVYFGFRFFTEIDGAITFQAFGLPEFKLLPFLSEYANLILVVYFPFNIMKYGVISAVLVTVTRIIDFKNYSLK